jgi:hypothetical protein
VAGWHNACQQVAAGDHVFLKGEGAIDKLHSVPVTGKSGAFTLGEQVTWDAGASVGTIAQDAGATLYIEEISGNPLAGGDSLVGTTSTNTATVSSATQYDIHFVTTGSQTAMIKWIGVNSSWVVDGTFAVANGNSAGGSSGPAAGLLQPNSSAVAYQWFENLECKNSLADGINLNGADFIVLVNVSSHDNGDDGIGMNTSIFCFLIGVRAYNNSDDGIPRPSDGCVLMFCASYNNTGAGYNANTSCFDAVFYQTIAHGNGEDGWQNFDSGNVWLNCIADENGDDGISFNDDGSFIGCCRLTNQSGAGDSGIAPGANWGVAAFNLFYNNAVEVVGGTQFWNIPWKAAMTNDLMSAGIDGSNKLDPDADDGYQDQANEDFNLKQNRTYTGRAADAIGLGIGS